MTDTNCTGETSDGHFTAERGAAESPGNETFLNIDFSTYTSELIVGMPCSQVSSPLNMPLEYSKGIIVKVQRECCANLSESPLLPLQTLY